jgi:hypothetical protein
LRPVAVSELVEADARSDVFRDGRRRPREATAAVCPALAGLAVELPEYGYVLGVRPYYSFVADSLD